MNMYKNITLGADIEMFLKDRETLAMVPSIGLIPGTKETPFELEPGYGIQPDNVAVEFTMPPSTNAEDFIQHVLHGKQLVETYIPGYLTVEASASHVFDSQQLQDPKAQEFGCDPDFNAWKADWNPKPNSKTNLRSNGFHIHIGYNNPSEEKSMWLIKCLDLYLGLPSLEKDLDQDRRKLYGKAGACRFKPYGVEYRVLSGYFVKNEELITWAATQTLKAIEFANSNNKIVMEDLIPTAINNSNVTLANSILEANKILITA